jgi:hypothetical protein
MTCGGCRERYARRQSLPPCEVEGQRCPFTPSPGFEGRVWSENRLAWYLWERAEQVGLSTALELLSLELSRREAEYLLNKLALLQALAAQHRRNKQQQG